MKGSGYITGIPTDPNEIIAHPEKTIKTIQANINRFQKNADVYMKRVSGGDVLDCEMLQFA